MTRITSSEQVIALLHAQLQRVERAQRKSTTATKRGERQTALQRVQAAVRESHLPDEQIERAVVAAILEDELGAEIANDPKLQAIVNDVAAALKEDAGCRQTLASALLRVRDKTG